MTAAEPCACRLIPCACAYTAALRVGGRLEALRQAALNEYAKPLPHRDACPCPPCYSTRLGSWETT